jgi:hypothetical protein
MPVFSPQNILLAEETRPLRFLVIQQIAENNTDLPIKPLSSQVSQAITDWRSKWDKNTSSSGDSVTVSFNGLHNHTQMWSY